ncbi:MAG: ComF family protein [Clostridiaceae bacterium]|nr:ComF family protein [Clostridiaceae bacterium]
MISGKNGDVSFFEKLIRLVYPAKCMVCDQVLNEDTFLHLCEPCKKNLPRYQKGFVRSMQMPYLDGIFAAFYYRDGIKNAIQCMKFKSHPRLAQTMGSLVCEELFKYQPVPEFELIVPVPMHPKKKRQRGYNQAELVANEVARKLNKDLRNDILIKVQNTTAQIRLKREERLMNLENAFMINNSIMKNNRNGRVLLVDDVLTTGTTVSTCAKILKENGFSSVYALIIAIAEK